MQQLSISVETQEKYLPARPTKRELADWAGYSKTESLYTDIITEARINKARNICPTITMDWVRSKHCRFIPAALAQVIYFECCIVSLR